MKRFYGFLLGLLCPAPFRNEYGSEMQSAFLARWRESSWIAGPWLILEAVADVATAGLAVHRDLLTQDLRHTWRTARRAPGYTATALAVASLGVASSTAVFTIADHVLLRPLPFPDPQNLVTLYEDQTRRGYPQMDISPPNFRDWKRMSTCFESIAAYRNVMANLSGGGAPEPVRISGASVTFDLFRTLRVAPLLGRDFTEQDDAPGAPRTIILSHRFWMQHFGGDPAVIGRKVLYDDEPSTVIGVMPAEFAYPRPLVKLWTPARMDETEYSDRGNYSLFGVARLKPGVTLEQARAAMRIIGSNLEKQYPADNRDANIYVGSLQGDMPNRVRAMIRILGAAAGFLLLIACANLTNLLLARSSARRKEIEIRAALGAGRERLVRQLITEGAALSVTGGVAGIALAAATVPLLGRLVPTGLPVVSTPTIDWRVAMFAFAATIVTGIAAGVLPALRVTANSSATLRVRGARSDSARRSLVIVQIAASLALVLSTGLLLRALVQVTSRDPGFETSGRMFFRTALAFPRYAETARREDFYRTVLDGVRALPGVTGASAVSFRPMGDMRGGIWSVLVPGETRTDAHAASRFVLPGYFDVMGIRILAGRDFRTTDTINSQRVAVVSQSFVREHWPGRLEDAIGRTFSVRFGNLSFTVAGVVSDIRFRGLEQAQHEPQMYFAAAQTPDNAFVFFAPKDFVVATALANPLSLAPAIRAIIAKADPSQPVSDIEGVEQLVESDTAGRRVQVWVIAAFSTAALLLAAIGIHGLLSFAVSRRTLEIGLRRALGAQASGIAWLILGEAAALALTGSVMGAAAAYLLGRGVMQAVLAGVPAGDPWTAAAGVAFAMLLTVAGSLAPTIRALRVDPAIALRSES